MCRSSRPDVPVRLEILSLGCLPKPPTGSNVRKGRFKRIQFHRLEKVGLKAFLASSKSDVPECLEILRFGWLPKPLQTISCFFLVTSLYFCVEKMNLRDHIYEKVGLNPSPMIQLGRAAASRAIINQFGLFRFLFFVSIDASRYRPIRTGRFIQDGNSHRNLNDATRTRHNIKRNH